MENKINNQYSNVNSQMVPVEVPQTNMTTDDTSDMNSYNEPEYVEVNSSTVKNNQRREPKLRFKRN